MIFETNHISVLASPALSSSLDGNEFKQITRTYPGNYSINFVIGLSAVNDFSTKNYTNFYLTNNLQLEEILEFKEKSSITCDVLYTKITYGGDGLYVKYISNNHGLPLFGEDNPNYAYNTRNFSIFDYSSDPPDYYFNIKLFDNNRCHVYQAKQNKKFYLACDVNNELYFVAEKFLSFDENYINPQDFIYLFSEEKNEMFLFKDTLSGGRYVTNFNKRATTIPILENDILTYIINPFALDTSIYIDPKFNLNTSFITYKNNNKIDLEKSILNLKNNFLIHKKYSDKTSFSDIIVLKNQLLVPDVFSSANNLLSGSPSDFYVDGLREYTSIFNDIKEETTDELELNYVFYNETYLIKEGVTTFTSPSSMYPFTQLNINDSKFINSGSFGYTTPEYADKIYHLSNVTQNRKYGQYLLCTWLSGSPFSDDKVWVDRYYYPDLITKEEALAAKPYAQPTYDELVESIIQSNSTLKSEVISDKIFDKRSDFVFEPNQVYKYERITTTNIPSLTTFNVCNSYGTTTPKNYFKTINNSGKLTFGITFRDENSSWIIKSDRNSLNAGLLIEKQQHQIRMEYKLYDHSTNSYYIFEKTEDIKQYKDNFVCFSFDSYTGNGYFCLNSDVVLTFSVGSYQFAKKQLLNGDIFIIYDGIKENILTHTKYTYNPFITDTFFEKELAVIIPILNGYQKIDELYVTLPCGMRNGFDNIQFLQTMCDSMAFKSNNINIIVKNLNLDNSTILDGIETSIRSSLAPFIPSNSKINTIKFSNFK